VEFRPAWDRRDMGQGQHVAEIHFIERRTAGMAHAVFYSGWTFDGEVLTRPHCAFLCFHPPGMEDSTPSEPGNIEAGVIERMQLALKLIREGDPAVWAALGRLFVQAKLEQAGLPF
jgi:hypothetical protein